jgi:hypothetical protein
MGLCTIHSVLMSVCPPLTTCGPDGAQVDVANVAPGTRLRIGEDGSQRTC